MDSTQQSEGIDQIIEKDFELDKDGIPRNNNLYKEKEYWDFRFQKETQYDWISSIEKMNENCEGLLEYIVQTLSIGKCLHLGCGTSTLAQTLANQGVKQLINCDYSEIVIKNMKEKYSESCGEWVVADITKLEDSFQQEQFDSVIEKCTLDALTVDPGDPWDPKQEVREIMEKVFDDDDDQSTKIEKQIHGNQKLINEIDKQENKQQQFIVGAGHAFYYSHEREQQENSIQQSTDREKIGENLFQIKKEKENDNIHYESSTDLEQSLDFKLRLTKKLSTYPYWFPWVCLACSVIWGACIPTWILQIPAERYLRTCWRFFSTAFWLIPLCIWESKQKNYSSLYTWQNLCGWQNLKNVALSSCGQSFWFTFIIFSFNYTSVSHAILLGNLQNFFLSVERNFKKDTKKNEMEIVGQFFVGSGILMIIWDSFTMDELQSDQREEFLMTNYLKHSPWVRVFLGDLVCILTSFALSKIQKVDTQVKSIYPPYLFILIQSVFSTFLMTLVSIIFGELNKSEDAFSGWLGVFSAQNIWTYTTLSFFCGFGLVISYIFVYKFFEPVVSASVLLFEPIICTILIYVFHVQSLPGPLACLGFVFQLPGSFLIILTQFIIKMHEDTKKISHNNNSVLANQLNQNENENQNNQIQNQKIEQQYETESVIQNDKNNLNFNQNLLINLKLQQNQNQNEDTKIDHKQNFNLKDKIIQQNNDSPSKIIQLQNLNILQSPGENNSLNKIQEQQNI